MRIKKDQDTKNEYIIADGVWVRNFTKEYVVPLTYNNLIPPSDYGILMENEDRNTGLQIANISDEPITFQKILIINDGYDFMKRHLALSKLPDDVAIFAVNRALSKWQLSSGSNRRSINLYVVNNPYADCMGYLPTRYYPACVASSRTNHEFLRRYKGRLYCYEPTPSRTFGVERKAVYYVDDYRNPICAAIGLAYQFKVNKLAMMCCDDSFEDHREASVKLNNGLYCYPQQLRTQRIIDANLYWLTHQEDHEVQVRDYSSGAEYENAAYISSEHEMFKFFSDEPELDISAHDGEET